MLPARQPGLGPLPDRDAPCLRVDVVASHQCDGLLVEPALRVDLAVKSSGDLAAARVAEVRPVPLARAVERGPFQLPGLAISPVPAVDPDRTSVLLPVAVEVKSLVNFKRPVPD